MAATSGMTRYVGSAHAEVVSHHPEVVAVPELAAAGKVIIVISSELPEVLGLADRVLVMRQGRLAGEVSGKAITEENIVRLAMGVAGGAGLGHDVLGLHQLLGLEAGLEAGRLRAVAAVLGAAAGLDRQKLRLLHLIRVEGAPVHRRRLEHQLHEGAGEQGLDLLQGPVMTGDREIAGGSDRCVVSHGTTA